MISISSHCLMKYWLQYTLNMFMTTTTMHVNLEIELRQASQPPRVEEMQTKYWMEGSQGETILLSLNEKGNKYILLKE